MPIDELTAVDVTKDNERPRVLIVDDDHDFAEGLLEILEMQGYPIQIAHDVDKAIAAAKGFVPEVALLDIRLGRSSGLDLLAALVAVRPGIVCVMMTGYAALETAVEALKQGAYDYLRKPINGDELLATLQRCHEKIRLRAAKEEAEARLVHRNRELHEINARLRTVVASARGMAACAYIQDLGPVLLEEFARNMGAEGGSIYLTEANRLKRIHALDPGHSPPSIALPLPAGSILERVMASGEAVLISDVEDDGVQTSGWPGYKDGSTLVFPLPNDAGRNVGVISLHNKTRPPFTRQDLELGILLASYSCETLRATQAIEALRRSENEYRHLVENLPEVFYRTDLDGKMVMVSPSVKRVLGYEPDELLGRDVAQTLWLKPEKREVFLAQISARGAVEGYESRFRTKGGELVWGSVNAHFYRDDAGKVLGVEGLFADITARKTMEAEHIRLATAVDQASELIFITDTDGKIEYVNPSFERVTGYTRSEVLGQNPRILKSGQHDPRFYAELWQTIARGDVWHGRLINRKKDGSLYQEEATISPIRDHKGRLINYVAVKRDASREATLEKQLRQAQKMEAIGTLAGGIAHDFNNILAAIIGYTELVKMDMPTASPLLASIGKVLKASYRARDLVSQILAFSRQTEQDLRPVSVSAIVKEVLKLLRASLPATIAIEQQIESEPANVLGDPTQIHQVIMNICTNAMHAMREGGGRLRVRLGDVRSGEDPGLSLQLARPEDYLHLAIQDSGHGMPTQIRDRIFEPYFTTKRKEEGTGLGLAVVHGIVTSHEGHIAVQSEPGQGCTFNIYLPRWADETKERKRTFAESLPRGHERVLLIDDEEDIVMVNRQMMERLGYEVVSFTHSLKALSRFQAEPAGFDIVITDMTMPDMTGDQVAAAVRARRPQVPIILCTGFSESITPEKAQALGISRMLMKPLGLAELARTMRELLD
jgi:PAS domain S-box-containing protein